MRRYFFFILFSPLMILLASCGAAPSMFNPYSPAAAEIATTGWILIGAAVIAVLVVTIMLLVGIRHREATVAVPEAKPPQGDTRLLLVFGGITAAVLVVTMALIILSESAFAATTRPATFTIKLTGHQWWWQVDYPDQQFTTANEIHIPVNEPVDVQLVSDDVIHSLWIPQLQGKLDLIPGKTNVTQLLATQTGVYRGECAEFCGAEHANMALDVIVQPRADFDTWVQQQQATPPVPGSSDPNYAGLQAFLDSACVYCHTIRGTNATGKVGPDLTHIATRSTLGAGTIPNTRGNLGGWIVDSQHIKPDNHMPPMYLNGPELQSLLDYLETLK